MPNNNREHKLEAFESLEMIYQSLADEEDGLENKVSCLHKQIVYGDKYIMLADPEDGRCQELIQQGPDTCLQLDLAMKDCGVQ